MVPGPVRSLPFEDLESRSEESNVMGSSYSSTRPSVNVIRKRVLQPPVECGMRADPKGAVTAEPLGFGRWSSDRAERREKFIGR